MDALPRTLRFIMSLTLATALLACSPQFHKKKLPAKLAAAVVKINYPSEGFEFVDGGAASGSSSSFAIKGGNFGAFKKTIGASNSFKVRGGLIGQMGQQDEY